MDKQLLEARNKDKRSNLLDWLWIFGDILLYIPRILFRLIRWFVDLF
ncbi:hypothetical protein [Oceanobacillus sp. CAU 1775]